MIVEFTSAARADLAAIGDWISLGNSVRAASFVDELIDRAESLSHWPERFPEVDARRWPGLRRLNHRGYRIYYHVRHDTVEVLNIHHGSRENLGI